ncbi:DoxX family protein [bacterium]|jgi:putative oxidoreductase|nr:DoxX family protein [bacterium]
MKLAMVSKNRDWFLRIGLASVFLFHGLMKFSVAAGMAKMMGMPIGIIYMIALAEVGGASLIILGGILKKPLLSKIAGLILTGIMIGAIGMVHWGQWSFMATTSHPMGGMEFQVVLMLISLFFVFDCGSKSESS